MWDCFRDRPSLAERHVTYFSFHQLYRAIDPHQTSKIGHKRTNRLSPHQMFVTPGRPFLHRNSGPIQTK